MNPVRAFLGTSPRTTIGGTMQAVGIAVLGAPATGLVASVPEWLAWAGIILAAVGSYWKGRETRDNYVDSETAGAKNDVMGRVQT